MWGISLVCHVLHYITLKINTTATEFYFRRLCFILAHIQMLRYYTYLLTAMSISVASSGIASQKYTQLHESFVLIKKCMTSINYLSLLRFSLLLPNCEGSHYALIYKFKDINLNMSGGGHFVMAALLSERYERLLNYVQMLCYLLTATWNSSTV